MDPKFYDTINDFLKNYNSPTISILDIGCAEVRPYSEFLINSSTKYTGLDKNEKLIAEARTRVDNTKCTLLLENVEDLNDKDETFDIIVCNNMLAYTDQKKVIGKMYRLLKKEGLCISYNNNTIAYSLYKITHPFKPVYIEISHSLIVILNTWFFRITGIKIFRTIYNTTNSLKKALEQFKYKKNDIINIKSDLPYNVINFYFIK